MPKVVIGNVQGPQGNRGFSVFTGSGAPSAGSPYVNGDSYIDTSNWNFYSYNGSAWSLVGTLQGGSGPAGNGIASIDLTSSVGLVDTYTITYTNGGSDTFTVTNGDVGPQGPQGPVGPAAGIASATASASATTGASGTSAGATVTPSVSGPDTGKAFDFAFTFQIPKGADGVVTDAMGAIGFQVDANGQLIAYTSSGTPNLAIDSNGQLIYTY